jgi:transposase
MLIHGARSVLLHLKSHPDQAEGWLARVATRRNPNIAAVALANKNARTVWALLAHGHLLLPSRAGYSSLLPAGPKHERLEVDVPGSRVFAA